jgi:hypothetical protein
MKTFILALSFLVSFSALAVPYRCVSIEKHENGNHTVNLKVNPKRNYVDTNGRTWSAYYLGITPATNLPFSRFTAYGQGSASDDGISLTLIDKDFILGTLSAKRVVGSNLMTGKLNLRKVKSGDIEIECFKN